MDKIKLNTFAPAKPHEKQKEVLKSLDEGSRYVLLRAGRKWRKTSLMISWLFEKAIQTGLTCPYIAPNRVQAKNITWSDHIPRILDEFSLKGFPYKTNEVELSVELPNRGKVQLLGVENKEALRGISNWGAVGSDEYDDWEEDIYPLIIRPNLITYKAPILIGGTPKGFKNIYRLEQGGNFKSFHFTSLDNPDISKEELDALIKEYQSMGMSYYRQEILAEYEKPVGTVYEEWDMEKNYIPFDYDPNLPVQIAWDFGVNDPTAVLFIQPFGEEIRIFDHYEASDADLKHFVEIIDSKGYKPQFETGDIAGRARSLITGKSVIDELAKLGHHIRTAPIPDIPTQIRHTHRFISRLYVSSSNPLCSRVRECLLNYRYPTKPEHNMNQSNEIPIHDEFSHAMRSFEYYCWNWFDPSKFKETKPTPKNTFQYYLEKAEKERSAQAYLGRM